MHIAAATHHIQLSLDERRELYLHNELYDEHNLPIVRGYGGFSCECQLRVSPPLAEVRVPPAPQESEVAGTSLTHRWRRTPLHRLHGTGLLLQTRFKVVTDTIEGPTSSTDGHDLVKE